MVTLFCKKWGLVFSLLLTVIAFCACSSSGGGDDGDDDPDTTITVADIVVTAVPGSININEQSAIKAVAYDASGSVISGVQVAFVLDKPSLASISPSIVTTNASGVASATLTARDLQGELNITASDGTVSGEPLQVSILSGVTAETINLSANPQTILTSGTSTITAEVLDTAGNPIPDGTSVLFSVTNTLFGTMSVGSATTVNGLATATFEAGTTPGTAVINAISGDANGSAEILVNQTNPTSLAFVVATPQLIAIRGSGGTEASNIDFQVNDQNGNPLSGINVAMTMEGPNGGEYIDDDATPKTISVSSDASGIARVTLRSGDVAGTVTILAEISVDGVVFKSRSAIVSIGGGVPSDSRFSVAATKLNVPGLNKNGLETEITAYIADRFGNYNILEGTVVTFMCEPDFAIDTQATSDANGLATVVARTQRTFRPGGEDVQPFAWENELLAYMQETFGWPYTNHPRDGQVSVMVMTDGEEKFDDPNANGTYDAGEPFMDTYDDPFIDYNDDNVYTTGATDPDEILINVNTADDDLTNDLWNMENGIWDADKKIFRNFKLLITGEPIIYITPMGFDIPNGGSQSFLFTVADENMNYPSAGTKITVSSDGGKVIFGSRELDDSSYLPPASASLANYIGRVVYGATLIDGDTDETDAPKTVGVTFTVSWEGKTIAYTIYGSLD